MVQTYPKRFRMGAINMNNHTGSLGSAQPPAPPAQSKQNGEERGKQVGREALLIPCPLSSMHISASAVP